MLVGCKKSLAINDDISASVDQTGNIVAFWVGQVDREKPVLVTETYAMYVEWTDSEKRFYLYDNGAKLMFKTSDFKKFLARLDKLPHGIEIQRFDTCTVSRMNAMPLEQFECLTGIMKRGNRKWATSAINGLDYEVVCYCESKGFRFP